MPTVAFSLICEGSLKVLEEIYDIKSVGIDGVAVSGFPCTVHPLQYFARFHFMPNELGDHIITIKLRDTDGKLVEVPLTRCFNVERAPMDQKGKLTVSLDIPSFEAESPCSLSITVYCDDEILDQIDLEVFEKPE